MVRSHGKVEKKECSVPCQRRCAAKVSGNERASIIKRTQKEAMRIATIATKDLKKDTKIHGINEKIKACNRYGHDPCSPREFKK